MISSNHLAPYKPQYDFTMWVFFASYYRCIPMDFLWSDSRPFKRKFIIQLKVPENESDILESVTKSVTQKEILNKFYFRAYIEWGTAWVNHEILSTFYMWILITLLLVLPLLRIFIFCYHFLRKLYIFRFTSVLPLSYSATKLNFPIVWNSENSPSYQISFLASNWGGSGGLFVNKWRNGVKYIYWIIMVINCYALFYYSGGDKNRVHGFRFIWIDCIGMRHLLFIFEVIAFPYIRLYCVSTR